MLIISLCLYLQSVWNRPSIEQLSLASNESIRPDQPGWGIRSWNHLHAH